MKQSAGQFVFNASRGSASAARAGHRTAARLAAMSNNDEATYDTTSNSCTPRRCTRRAYALAAAMC
jgi:hypothetical protein